ncbi:Meiotic recombination protein SPO11-2 [Capsicum annuum]|nr:Meiotic recombination protein SPO11-2 [Capsicum annuum]
MGELSRSTIFFSDQHLCYADILSPSQVRARIEVAVLNFLKALSSNSPSISDLSLVMEICYQVLVQEKRVTQRELYYKLLCDSPDYFTSQLQVNRTIQGTDLVALLRCSRYSLGIMASSRGAIAGRLLLQVGVRSAYTLLCPDPTAWDYTGKEPDKEVVDCSTCGSSGYAISGDLELLGKLTMGTDARYIIMVEKRLAEDRVFNQIPCILITAKGFPDIATRFLLHRMCKMFPNLLVLGLVDWNPAGLAILCTFKFGSIGMGLEAYRYACNIKWLGLRKDDINQLIPKECLVPLKPRDLQIAKSLMSSEILQDSYKEEVAAMVQSGRRAEIEALYCHGYDYLVKFLATKIVQANYL